MYRISRLLITPKKGALTTSSLKKTKANQKNPKKHLENPPKMYTL